MKKKDEKRQYLKNFIVVKREKLHSFENATLKKGRFNSFVSKIDGLWSSHTILVASWHLRSKSKASLKIKASLHGVRSFCRFCVNYWISTGFAWIMSFRQAVKSWNWCKISKDFWCYFLTAAKFCILGHL